MVATVQVQWSALLLAVAVAVVALLLAVAVEMVEGLLARALRVPFLGCLCPAPSLKTSAVTAIRILVTLAP